MEGVEDLPGTVLHEGLSWEWESIGDYLDHVVAREYDIDLATQVCHGPVRVYVMVSAAPTARWRRRGVVEMGRIAAEGIRAGALGFGAPRAR